MQSYDHLIHIDEAKRELIVYRIDDHGQRTLYTSVPLPTAEEVTSKLESFARQLGENLLLDSPAARRLLKL